jgi:hypothetical protein
MTENRFFLCGSAGLKQSLFAWSLLRNRLRESVVLGVFDLMPLTLGVFFSGERRV